MRCVLVLKKLQTWIRTFEFLEDKHVMDVEFNISFASKVLKLCANSCVRILDVFARLLTA